jgi:hypothetical protein
MSADLDGSTVQVAWIAQTDQDFILGTVLYQESKNAWSHPLTQTFTGITSQVSVDVADNGLESVLMISSGSDVLAQSFDLTLAFPPPEPNFATVYTAPNSSAISTVSLAVLKETQVSMLWTELNEDATTTLKYCITQMTSLSCLNSFVTLVSNDASTTMHYYMVAVGSQLGIVYTKGLLSTSATINVLMGFPSGGTTNGYVIANAAEQVTAFCDVSVHINAAAYAGG